MSAGKALGSMLMAMVALALTAGSAAAQTPIGPNQQFAGVINGSAAKAVVHVVCPGPVGPNSTGPPVAGQGVQVVENTGTSVACSGALKASPADNPNSHAVVGILKFHGRHLKDFELLFPPRFEVAD